MNSSAIKISNLISFAFIVLALKDGRDCGQPGFTRDLLISTLSCLVQERLLVGVVDIVQVGGSLADSAAAAADDDDDGDAAETEEDAENDGNGVCRRCSGFESSVEISETRVIERDDASYGSALISVSWAFSIDGTLAWAL